MFLNVFTFSGWTDPCSGSSWVCSGGNSWSQNVMWQNVGVCKKINRKPWSIKQPSTHPYSSKISLVSNKWIPVAMYQGFIRSSRLRLLSQIIKRLIIWYYQGCFLTWIILYTFIQVEWNLLKCPWARHWTLNCSRCCTIGMWVHVWMVTTEEQVAPYKVHTATSFWMCVWMGDCWLVV